MGFIVEDTYKAGAFRIHFAESVRKRQTRTSHGECSDFSVTDCQRDEVERAGVRCNKAHTSRIQNIKKYLPARRIQARQKQCPVKKMSICGKYELKFQSS